MGQSTDVTIKFSYSTLQGCVIGFSVGVFALLLQHHPQNICPPNKPCPTISNVAWNPPCPTCPAVAPPPANQMLQRYDQVKFNDLLERTPEQLAAMEAFETPRGVHVASFTKEECEWIVEHAKKLNPVAGKVQDGAPATGNHTQIKNHIKSQARRAYVAPLDRFSEEYAWVYDRIQRGINAMNNKYWKYVIPVNYKSRLTETIQFLEYRDVDLGMYSWHQDVGIKGSTAKRRMSAITFLSDPSEYEGGRLQVRTVGEEWNIDHTRGHTFIFPSYMLHQVTNVTKGTRHTMAMWIQEV